MQLLSNLEAACQAEELHWPEHAADLQRANERERYGMPVLRPFVYSDSIFWKINAAVASPS